MWRPKPASLIEQCVEDLTAGWREVYVNDRHGRRVRAMHAITKKKEGGKQETIWTRIDGTSHDDMELLVGQRRKQIVGQIVHLNLVVEHYNDINPREPAIQLVLNFENDVLEFTQPVATAPLAPPSV